MQEVDPNSVPGHRNSEQRVPSSSAKDRVSAAQELSQLARLFCKFITVTNARTTAFIQDITNSLRHNRAWCCRPLRTRCLSRRHRERWGSNGASRGARVREPTICGCRGGGSWGRWGTDRGRGRVGRGRDGRVRTGRASMGLLPPWRLTSATTTR
jgi:hypothetical protein